MGAFHAEMNTEGVLAGIYMMGKCRDASFSSVNFENCGKLSDQLQDTWDCVCIVTRSLACPTLSSPVSGIW